MAQPDERSKTAGEEQLRAVIDAGIAIASAELSLDELLQTLARKAAEVTGARYAAIGIREPAGETLERFVTHGMSEDVQAAIGDPPRGRGLLGALIDEAGPIRLTDLGSDPRSAGFPRGHPPMRSFLGVPIVLRGRVYGNLYMTEKDDGFTKADEELAALIAAHAAVAVENSRLFESATRWARRLETLQETGNALAGELDLQALLDLISRRLRELLDARLVAIALIRDDELEVRSAAGEGGDALIGFRVPAATSKLGRVVERGRSERVESAADDPESHPELRARLGARPALYVPLVAGDRRLGVVAAVDRDRSGRSFPDDDVRLAELFATRAAIAIALSERIRRESLRRVVDAQESERRRIARELHDQTGQALTSILFGVRELRAAADVGEARRAADSITSLVSEALEDIRRLALELRPQILDDFGLAPALERLTASFADRTGTVVELRAPPDDDERLTADQETTLYRAAQEALTNAARHAEAAHVAVELVRLDAHVELTVSDDGRGFAGPAIGPDSLGLAAMRERVSLVGGSLVIDTSPGAGTVVRVTLPTRRGNPGPPAA
ncbi:MAG TPA: GAF domain-containing protein [Gaiellaceae bacterium]|nr:GAF domain-containing protein [Gaiellaceae bacterium]